MGVTALKRKLRRKQLENLKKKVGLIGNLSNGTNKDSLDPEGTFTWIFSKVKLLVLLWK